MLEPVETMGELVEMRDVEESYSVLHYSHFIQSQWTKWPPVES